MSSQQTTYFTTIRNLEEKYKKIELEANGHFSAFVTQIKSQYAVKFDTFRQATNFLGFMDNAYPSFFKKTDGRSQERIEREADRI